MQTNSPSSKKNLYIPILSIGLIPQRHRLSIALDQKVQVGLLPQKHRQWLGWGEKRSAKRAKMLASINNSCTGQLEDGFIRSIGLPVDKFPVWSVIYDHVGIYYNAYQTSALEQLINTTELTNKTRQRAHNCINLICNHHITKYNHAPDLKVDCEVNKQHILVVDQTYGDLSIKASGATAETFQAMLNSALDNHPDAVIWVKTHPEVSAHHKQGHFSLQQHHPRIRYITETANPISILKQMDEIYVVSSQMGFEALILKKTVHCFGLPWYAGWGLTDDSCAPTHLLGSRRQTGKTLEHLFTAAYFEYCRYINPYTEQKCELENILDIAIQQKYWNEKLSGHVRCVGFSPWKKHFLRNYLKLPTLKLSFSNELPSDKEKNIDHVIIWGMKQPNADDTIKHAKLWRMEDGFVRSVGLGAKLIAPYSLVLDDEGIYYNPQQPSRLENILSKIQLTPEQHKRIRAVINTLIKENISKYNLSGMNDWPQNIPANKRKLLVPGQVSDDASIQYGALLSCNSNQQLLKAVREKNPNAFIIYKPHPDVVSGLRNGEMSIEDAQQYADAVITQTSMATCLTLCDEVHTMTSLTGFEALLRQIPVTCYGQPFYSGWGLTTDVESQPRRNRRLDLETLVYSTLIDYPFYTYRQQNLGAAIEDILTQIAFEKTLPNKERGFFSHLLPFIKRFRH